MLIDEWIGFTSSCVSILLDVLFYGQETSMILLDLPQATLLFAGLLSALTFVVALLRRRLHPQAAQALIGYTFIMAVWVSWLAAWKTATSID